MTTKPPPTIAIAVIIPSMGCICVGSKRLLGEVAIGISGDRVIGGTWRISTIVVGWWTVGVGYVYGLGRRRRATIFEGRVNIIVGIDGVEYYMRGIEEWQWLWRIGGVRFFIIVFYFGVTYLGCAGCSHWFVQEMLVCPWFITLNSGLRRHQLSRKLRFAQKVGIFCMYVEPA